ncbi:hypothetical protein TRVL_08467 [Trypanosoma vivax]|nr:hypothetical protein TRVL_08467 [Trypanosoma vivax]
MQPLTQLAQLEELNIAAEEVENSPCLLEMPRLRSVSLRSCEIYEDLLSHLSRMSALEQLALVHVNILTRLGKINSMPKLRALELAHTNITKQLLRGLHGNKNISRLVLDNVELSDFSALVGLEALDELVIISCSGHERSADDLGKHAKLRSLTVEKTHVTSCWLSGLCESKTLAHLILNLPTPEYGTTDVSPLGELAPLETVKISRYTEVTDECHERYECGYEPEALQGVGALGKLPRLREVCYKDYHMDRDALDGLSASKSIKRLSLVMDTQIDYVDQLARLESLEELEINRCEKLRGAGKLGELPRLRLLDLCGYCYTDDTLLGLGKSRSLTVLRILSSNHLSDISPIREMESLEVFELLGPLYCFDNVDVLGSLPRLREVTLTDVGFLDDSLNALCRSKSVVSLTLNDCRKITDATPLAGMATLEEVTVRKCRRLKNLDALVALPRLRKVRHDGCLAEEVEAGLRQKGVDVA